MLAKHAHAHTFSEHSQDISSSSQCKARRCVNLVCIQSTGAQSLFQDISPESGVHKLAHMMQLLPHALAKGLANAQRRALHVRARAWLTVTTRSDTATAPFRMLKAGPLMAAQLGNSQASAPYLLTAMCANVEHVRKKIWHCRRHINTQMSDDHSECTAVN